MTDSKPFLLIEGAEVKETFAKLDGEYFNQIVLVLPRARPYNDIIRTNKSTGIELPLLSLIKDNINDFQGEKQITFVYYITSEPKTLEECSSQLAAITLGMPSVYWFHHYSDLTGYLWTTVYFEANEDKKGPKHDIENELRVSIKKLSSENGTDKAYLTLEIRAH